VTFRLNNAQLPKSIDWEQALISTINPGTFFMREDKIVQVIRGSGNNVVIQEEDTLNEFIIDLIAVCTLLESYLN
jgi:hypothetical protein